ncbi:ribose operon repressor [Desmospora sp. 8437]|nr:ribose operon repressor [Desmospora sp. 8437]
MFCNIVIDFKNVIDYKLFRSFVMNKPTMKDVARLSGVSTATVSRVLNKSGAVREEMKRRVAAAMEELGYKPNGVARSLRKNQTKTIGVIIPDISNPYFMKASKGIEDILYPKGYHLIFCSSDENPRKEQNLLTLLSEKRVDAIVVATAGGNEDFIRYLHSSGIPIMLIDRKIEGGGLDLIAEDNFQGAYRLTKKVLDQGHRRIGIVNGLLGVSTGKDRKAGFEKAIGEYGIDQDPQLVFDGSFTEESGRRAAARFMQLADRPTAIVCLNNLMASGVLLQLNQQGVDIRDIVVASYGSIEMAPLVAPHDSLITVKQYPYDMGNRAAQILLARLQKEGEEPREEILETGLD